MKLHNAAVLALELLLDLCDDCLLHAACCYFACTTFKDLADRHSPRIWCRTRPKLLSASMMAHVDPEHPATSGAS